MSKLQAALESARPDIEKALTEAEKELGQLVARQRELEDLIARARAALGHPIARRSDRLTLHDAIEMVLQENNNDWMTVADLAAAINERGLYTKRDGTPVEPNQIHARTKNYSQTFQKKGPRIRLKEQPATTAPTKGSAQKK
jgi:hypothetical protein